MSTRPPASGMRGDPRSTADQCEERVGEDSRRELPLEARWAPLLLQVRTGYSVCSAVLHRAEREGARLGPVQDASQLFCQAGEPHERQLWSRCSSGFLAAVCVCCRRHLFLLPAAASGTLAGLRVV